jgi:hypothetical protein
VRSCEELEKPEGKESTENSGILGAWCSRLTKKGEKSFPHPSIPVLPLLALRHLLFFTRCLERTGFFRFSPATGDDITQDPRIFCPYLSLGFSMSPKRTHLERTAVNRGKSI